MSKNECANYKAYINLPRYRLKTYDFIFIDGICQAHAAVAISFWVISWALRPPLLFHVYEKMNNENAFLVIRNTKLLKNKYLSIIHSLYKPIEEYDIVILNSLLDCLHSYLPNSLLIQVSL